MTEPTATDPSALGDPERARTALGRAVVAARTGEGSLSGRVSKADLRALGPRSTRELLDQLLVARHADIGLESLLGCGVLDALLPEVAALVGFSDYEWRHKDVWRHTKQVVIQAVPRVHIRWAALLHDVGKVKTRSIAPDGKVTFLGHPEVGARLFDKLCRREKLFAHDEPLRKAIRFLVLHHQRASQYEEGWTDSAVRRFAREMGEHLHDLLLLARADMTTKRRDKRRRYMFELKALQDRISWLAAEDARVPALPSGIGEHLMKELGIPPSKRIGEIKKLLEAAVEEGILPRQAEPEAYLSYIKSHAEDFGVTT